MIQVGGVTMTFTCDRCHGDYGAREANAVAHIYVKDSRCNHVEARCTNCGTTEVIFLGPHRIEDVIRGGSLQVEVLAEATAGLRVRAENAWAAAEKATAPEVDPSRPVGSTGPRATDGEPATEPVRTFDLTERHEKLISGFGQALLNIPDELLWDGMRGQTQRERPERWTD
jgi:hypothetical protein